MSSTLLQLATASGSQEAIQMAKDSIIRKPMLYMLPFQKTNGMSFQSATGTVPTITTSGINQGYGNSSGILEPKNFKVAQYSARSSVDVREADQYAEGGANAYREIRDDLVLEGMLNAFASDLFYANQNTNSNDFYGLSRYTNTLNAETIVDGGNSDADTQTSIYFVKFGELGVSGIYNAQASPFPTTVDMGRQLVDAPDGGGQMSAYVREFDWKAGIKVNEAGIGRLANVKLSANVTPAKMDTISTYIKNGVDAIFCNRKGKTFLNILQNNSLETMVLDTEMGLAVQSFQGIPIFVDDSIVNTEAVIS